MKTLKSMAMVAVIAFLAAIRFFYSAKPPRARYRSLWATFLEQLWIIGFLVYKQQFAVLGQRP